MSQTVGQKAAQKRYRDRNRERINSTQRRRTAQNPGKAADISTKSRVKRYGLSLEGYKELARLQEEKCAICGGETEGRRLSVDHCHSTGAIRGLLCTGCNMGIGALRDDPILLMQAYKYLTGGLSTCL